jgi:hypothetical protein
MILMMVMTVSASISVSNGYSGSGWGVAVNCSDKWSGTITGDATVNKFEGTGNTSYTVNGARQSVSAHIKKATNSTSTLKVDVLMNGKIVESKITNSSYGVILLPVSFNRYQ